MKTGDSTKKTVLDHWSDRRLGKGSGPVAGEARLSRFCAGRSSEKLAQLDAVARAKKVLLESVALDVCSDDSVRSGVNHVLAKAGAIDVLVNNAGVNYTARSRRSQQWRPGAHSSRRIFFGVLRVTRAVLPQMRERRSGRILMMSSISGLITAPTQGAYSSSKHALEALSNALRMELYPFGLPVVLIEPGYIVTGIGKAAADLSKPYVEKGGPYASLYERFFISVNAARERSRTTPEDCARVMLHAIETARPKPRYGVTSLYYFMKWSKWLLTDSAMDGILRRRFGVVREN